jgi:hypothetical protein
MEIENGRRAACDRCRGQKLRCVGMKNPIFKPGSRFQRSEVPCERCKKAKVVCFSVRRAPRRSLVSEGGDDQVTPLIQQWSPKRPSSLPQSPELSQSGSKTPQEDLFPAKNQLQQTISTGVDNRDDREPLAGDTNTRSGTPATISSEWLTYLHENDLGWSDIGMETPSSGMLDLDLGLYQTQESIEGLSGGVHGMIDPNQAAPAVQWDSDKIEILSNLNQRPQLPKPPQVGLPATQLPLEGQTRTYVLQDRETSESKQACIQELSKLNEILLQEESYMGDTSARPRVIGQTLQHCKDLLSILRCLKIVCYKNHPEKARSSDCRCSHEH